MCIHTHIHTHTHTHSHTLKISIYRSNILARHAWFKTKFSVSPPNHYLLIPLMFPILVNDTTGHPLAQVPNFRVIVDAHFDHIPHPGWKEIQVAHILKYTQNLPLTACFFQSNSQVPPEKCEPENFLFSSSLSALHTGYRYVENKIWIFNPCSSGPHKTYFLFAYLISAPSLHLACHAAIILAFLLFFKCAQVFYYRTFALLFLLHECISLT